jgi:hypothetical protein
LIHAEFHKKKLIQRIKMDCIKQLEIAYCENLILVKRERIARLSGQKYVGESSKTLIRPRFDCRSEEALIQKEVYGGYVPLLNHLDQEISRAMMSKRIIPIQLTHYDKTNITNFENICTNGNDDFLGQCMKSRVL